jgi:SAM-dependent methyltransferase
MTGELEYVGLMALAWDPLRGDTSAWEDRGFYLDLVRERGEPVLDIGCGTGRLLLDYLALGVDIDGVEISPDMVAILRSKAASAGLDVEGRVFQQAMEVLDLPRRYRTIIVPSSSFQLVLDPGDAGEAVRRFIGHLVPGGVIALPFYAYDRAEDETWTREAPLPDGRIVRRTTRAWVEPAARLEHSDETYELLEDGVVVARQHQVRSPATRGYSQAEARSLLETTGFIDLVVYREFTRDPARPDEALYTIVARRP